MKYSLDSFTALNDNQLEALEDCRYALSLSDVAFEQYLSIWLSDGDDMSSDDMSEDDKQYKHMLLKIKENV